MKYLWAMIAALGLFPLQAAQAALFDVAYTGAIDSILIPEGAQGLSVGAPVTVSFRYDSNDLVDVSNAPGLPAFGASSIPGLYAVTLSEPYDSLTVRFGGQTFHAADDYEYGSNAGLAGFPNFPQAYFLNGALLGIDFEGFYDKVTDFAFVSLEHYAEPQLAISDLLGIYYPDPSDYSIFETSFTGSFDIAGATITSVPEPSTWTLMIIGVGASGVILRSRRRSRSLPTVTMIR